MADITKIIQIEFKGDQTVGQLKKTVEDLNTSMESLEDSSKETTDTFEDLSKVIGTDLTNKTKALNEVVENTTSSVDSLKKQYREATEEAQKAEFGSAEFINASQRAGELKDQIDDTNDAIRGFASEPIENITSQFGQLSRSVLTLDFKKATTQFGTFRDTLKTVNFGQIGKDAKEFGKTLGGGLTDAFKSLGRVILANPILLIASILIGLGAALVALKDKFPPLQAAFEILTAPITLLIDGLKALGDFLGITTFAAEEKAEAIVAASEKEQAAIEERYDREIALAAAAGQNTKTIELEKQKAIKDSVDKQVAALEELKQAQGELTDENKTKLEELKKTARDVQTEIDVIGIQIQTEIDEARKKEEEDRQKDADARAKDRQKRAEEAKKDLESVKKFLEDRRIAQLDAQTRELTQLDAQYAEQIKKARGNSQVLLQLDAQFALDRDAINKKFEDERLDNLREVEKTLEDEKKSALNREIEATSQGFLERQKIAENYYNEEIRLATGNPERIAELEASKTDLILRITEARFNAVQQVIDTANIEQLEKDRQVQNEIALAGLEGRDLLLEQRSQETEDLKVYYDEQRRLAGDNSALIVQLNDAEKAALALKNKQFRDEDAQAEQQLATMRLQALSSVFSSISSLTDTFAGKSEKAQRKAFAIQKAANISQAVIAGILSVQQALATPPGPPVSIPFGVAAGIAAAANIAKIAATPFGGGSGGSGGGTSIPNAAAPATSPIPTPPTFQAPQFFGIGQTSQPVGQPIVIQNNISANGVSEVQNDINTIETRAQIIN